MQQIVEDFARIRRLEKNKIWSHKAFCHTVRKIKHHHVMALGGNATQQVPDKRPHDWTKKVLLMVEAVAEIHLVIFFNKTAVLARQAGRVTIEQTDMKLVKNHERKTKEGLTAENIGEIVKIIRKPRAEQWAE